MGVVQPHPRVYGSSSYISGDSTTTVHTLTFVNVGALSPFTFHRSAVRYCRSQRIGCLESCVRRWHAPITRPVLGVSTYQAFGLDIDMAALEHPTSWDDFSMPGIEEPHFMSNNAKPASPSSTTSSAGTKRKRATEPKFYAVRVGYHPGIYHSWSDCLAEVTGFKNATCEFGLRSHVILN